MNDDPIPFEPDQLDELLSAALDGELDAATSDLGLSLDEVSARLQATPGADARRAELAAARELLAEPVEIDELIAARLRTNAVRAAGETSAVPLAATTSRRVEWLWRSAGIAAAIAGLVAVGFAVGGNQSSTKSASTAAPESVDSGVDNSPAPGATAPQTTQPQVQALGSFTTARELAQTAVDRGLDAAGSLTPSPTSVYSGANQVALPSTGFAARSTTASGANQYDSAKRARPDASNPATGGRPFCPVPADVPIRATPTLHGTATLSGKPVNVTVFIANGEHIVVVHDTNCALVNLQMLG